MPETTLDADSDQISSSTILKAGLKITKLRVVPLIRGVSERMIICNCRAISESRIRDVIHAGADTVDGVEEACGAGGDCGSCRYDIEDLLEEHGPIAAHGQCQKAASGQGACANCPRAQGDNGTSRAA